MLSTVWIVSYLALGLPAIVAGFLVVHGGGFLSTTWQYGVAVIVLAVLALAGLAWSGSTPADERPGIGRTVAGGEHHAEAALPSSMCSKAGPIALERGHFDPHSDLARHCQAKRWLWIDGYWGRDGSDVTARTGTATRARAGGRIQSKRVMAKVPTPNPTPSRQTPVHLSAENTIPAVTEPMAPPTK